MIIADKLPPLPYSFDALEPYIDARTMEIHHDMHHAGYVKKLIAALESHPGLENQPVKQILLNLNKFAEPTRTAVRNNGGGHYNHSLFWPMMKKDGGGKPVGSVAKAIENSFENFESFQNKFNTAAKTVFGSGWAWLCLNEEGNLEIMATPNQDNPILHGKQPVLGLDVWEHAYYLKYQNKRPSYIDAWWHVINWEQIEQNYRQAVQEL